MLRALPVTSAIDNILNAFLVLVYEIFKGPSTGYLAMLINTITNTPLLLLGAVLMLCGFVLGILSRIIHN